MNERRSEWTDNRSRNVGITLLKAMVMIAIGSIAGCNRGSDSNQTAIVNYSGVKNGGSEYKQPKVGFEIMKPTPGAIFTVDAPIEYEIIINLGETTEKPAFCVVELFIKKGSSLLMYGNDFPRIEQKNEREYLCRGKLRQPVAWKPGKYLFVVRATDTVKDVKSEGARMIELAKSQIEIIIK
jgi:hypothetical protein